MHAAPVVYNFTIASSSLCQLPSESERKNPLYLANTIASESKYKKKIMTHSKEIMQYLSYQCTAELIQVLKHL